MASAAHFSNTGLTDDLAFSLRQFTEQAKTSIIAEYLAKEYQIQEKIQAAVNGSNSEESRRLQQQLARHRQSAEDRLNTLADSITSLSFASPYEPQLRATVQPTDKRDPRLFMKSAYQEEKKGYDHPAQVRSKHQEEKKGYDHPAQMKSADQDEEEEYNPHTKGYERKTRGYDHPAQMKSADQDEEEEYNLHTKGYDRKTRGYDHPAQMKSADQDEEEEYNPQTKGYDRKARGYDHLAKEKLAPAVPNDLRHTPVSVGYLGDPIGKRDSSLRRQCLHKKSSQVLTSA
jgi:hypothetical protein